MLSIPLSVLTSVLLIVVGVAGVVVGSELAISAAIRLARRSGMPPIVIGLTLTSVGTSLPEIATNVAAGLSSRAGHDASGLLIGNIIGSCLSQATLLLGLLGLAAALRKPANFRRDGAMMFAAALAMFAVCLDGVATPLEGAGLIVGYVVYLSVVVRSGRDEEDEPEDASPGLARDLVVSIGGLLVLVVCADLVVSQAAAIAAALGTDDVVIGMIIGLGTGIPELTVALQAARKGAAALGLGNLIGSNITDPMLSFSAGVVLHEVRVPAQALWFDFPCWLVCTALALWFMHTRDRLSRLEAATLVALFFAFVVARVLVSDA